MQKITAIEPQRRNPNRVNLHLDGTFAFSLSRITAGWLKVGQDLSEEKIAALQAEDTNESVYQKALHFLSYRPRTEYEVRQNLQKRGIPQEIIDSTVERLQRSGLVNDQDFARLWVENRAAFRPRGARLLRLELQRKGLPDELVQPVLDQQVDEEALAFQAARHYASRLSGLDWNTFRRRLGGFLARRGFAYSVLSPIVSAVWKETRAETKKETSHDKD